jgi:hypothetical protein
MQRREASKYQIGEFSLASLPISTATYQIQSRPDAQFNTLLRN